VKIHFLGAAREVTGSCFLVETGSARFLVDCGLFQGGREAPRKNLAFPAFDPAGLDFAIVTHAHLDHCGLLPRLARGRVNFPVFATKPTADLLPVMLRDSAHIQEREAAYAARHQRRLDPGALLYGIADVDHAMRLVSGVPYGTEFKPHPDVRVRFLNAGHILGAAITEIRLREGRRERRVVFSGDLGQPARPVVNDPEKVGAADVLVVESTYGNRLHKTMQETTRELVAAVRETLDDRQGNLVIPAFALGRTQDLLVLLFELCEKGELGRLHVFVDSPLAWAATQVTLAHLEALDPVARRFADALRKKRLPYSLHFTETAEDSMAINAIRSGAIVIAASGMCDAGRVRHHLRHNLAREECGVLFTGFQAAGTLGRRLVDGVQRVQLFRESIPVRARLYTLGGLSAHADQRALLDWLGAFRKPPARTFVVHGEETTALAFASAVEAGLGWTIDVPAPGAVAEC
jgi:metallo-beta-lactamase family protein